MIEKKTPKSPRVVTKAVSKFFKSMVPKGASKKKKQTDAAKENLKENGLQKSDASLEGSDDEMQNGMMDPYGSAAYEKSFSRKNHQPSQSSSTASEKRSEIDDNPKVPMYGGIGHKMAMNLEPISQMPRSPRENKSSPVHSQLSQEFRQELADLLLKHASRKGRNGGPYVPGEKGLPYVRKAITGELNRNDKLSGWTGNERTKLVALISALQEDEFKMTAWTQFRDVMLKNPGIKQEMAQKQQSVATANERASYPSIVPTPRPFVDSSQGSLLESTAKNYLNMNNAKGLALSDSQIVEGIRSLLSQQMGGNLTKPIIDDFIQHVLPAMVGDWRQWLVLQAKPEFQGLLNELI